MTFNSLQYLVFLPFVAVLYRLLPRRGRQLLLLVASYVFYGAWDYRFLGLLAASTLTDYTVARLMGRMPMSETRTRRRLLLVSVTVNLGILGAFKYANFFADGLEDLLDQVGLAANPGTLALVLPVGISFYTFQTLGYTIDVYRGRIAPERDPVVFAVYVAYFPQLVAGPIERADRLLPQLRVVDRRLDPDRVASAVALIAMGLVKKVVIADQLARIADSAFTTDPTIVSSTVGIVSFAGQIYGDFSGYTDIARGSSRLFGIELMENFASPYLSRSITEFWRRWHISLSSWLRDYLYIPLGGNQGSPLHTGINLMITMLLGGLWHGASWTYVIWGGLHGGALLVERLYRHGLPDPSSRLRARQLPAVLGTFAFVCFAWVFFRSSSVDAAIDYLGGWTNLAGWDLATNEWLWFVGGVALLIAHDILRPRVGYRQLLDRPGLSGSLVGAAVIAVIIVSGQTPVPFLYFQF